MEVQTYYGALDTLEAQYPGLDYTYLPHRRRMSRYPWHRRLFRVFDELGLTDNEILNLCQWEGTRAAKERYEREAQTEVKTTTANDVVSAPPGSGPRAVFEEWFSHAPSEERSSDGETVVEVEKKSEPEDVDKVNEDLDDTVPTQPQEMLELLRTAVQSRSRAISTMATSQAWEQWLKDALERHEMDIDSIMAALESIDAEPIPTPDDDQDPQPVMSADPNASSPIAVPGSNPEHHTYDELHTMVDQLQTDNTRLAADNAALAFFLRRTQTEAAR